MRWSTFPKWVETTVQVVTAPAWVPLFAAIFAVWWLDENSRKLKRHFLGPYVTRWQRWFAWHPVQLDGGWGDWVWLATVERKSIGSSYNYGIVYQMPDEDPNPQATGR